MAGILSTGGKMLTGEHRSVRRNVCPVFTLFTAHPT